MRAKDFITESPHLRDLENRLPKIGFDEITEFVLMLQEMKQKQQLITINEQNY